MNEIITISKKEINGAEVNSVNARELHKTLGVGKDFSNWIKPKLKDNMLEEGRDYITYAQKGDGGKFGSIEYILTLDTAKHIAMMSRTSKAKEVRDYFIQVEKEYIKSLSSSNSANVALDVAKVLQPSLELIGQGMNALAQTQQQILELLKNQQPRVQNITNIKTANTKNILSKREAIISEAEKVFVWAVRDLLLEYPQGVNQETILQALGRVRGDKTATRRLHKYVDVYWTLDVDATSYIYTLLEDEEIA